MPIAAPAMTMVNDLRANLTAKHSQSARLETSSGPQIRTRVNGLSEGLVVKKHRSARPLTAGNRWAQ
jgi:hypothetical protein